ncbi:capsular biosynthesis protein [Prevotella sp. CAG:1320]|nr:capsular biosynthesis protein [Prevotella sp. CAG:1320]
MKNIKIGVAYHKKSLIVRNECYLPIQVGKELHPELNLGIQPDNEGENISDKNDYYCELTALYWIWKNVNADYKGLCHYRRFFSHKTSITYLLYNFFRPIQSLRSHLFFNTPNIYYVDDKQYEVDTDKTICKIDKLLDKYAIICPKKQVENRSSYWHFLPYGIEIMELLRDTIKKYYPTYFDHIKYVEAPSSFHFGNMSVMRNDIFDEYCRFLFDVLGKVETALIEDEWYNDLHKEKVFLRKLGYFGEYLTDLFIRKKETEGINIKELYIAFLK